MTNGKPIASVVASPKLEEAKAKAEAERARLREEGKHEGLRLAGRYRDGALVAVGFIVGLMCGMMVAATMIKDASWNAAAVADRVLARTVEPPVFAPPPATVSAEEYNANAEDARAQACRDGVRRACSRGVEPASAPRE